MGNNRKMMSSGLHCYQIRIKVPIGHRPKIIRTQKTCISSALRFNIVIQLSKMPAKGTELAGDPYQFTCAKGHPVGAATERCSHCGAKVEPPSIMSAERKDFPEASPSPRTSMVLVGEAETNSITVLLLQIQKGNTQAENRLVLLVSSELIRLSRYYMRGERSGHTLQTSDLVQECYMHLRRITKEQGTIWESRAQFFVMAARIMRHILVDHARKR